MTLAEQAADRLRRALLHGALPDRGPMTERIACDFLGMSRTPVRAALQTLANEGLLRHEPNRGYRIRRITPETVIEAYQVRAVLEGLACRRLAEAGLPAPTHRTLETCVAEGYGMLAAADHRFDHDAWRAMNATFHATILKAAGSDILLGAIRQAEGVPLSSAQMMPTMHAEPDFALLRQSHVDHDRIFHALANGQAIRAERRMQEHVEVAGDIVVRRMEQEADAAPRGA